jgi:hypothetical protein
VHVASLKSDLLCRQSSDARPRLSSSRRFEFRHAESALAFAGAVQDTRTSGVGTSTDAIGCREDAPTPSNSQRQRQPFPRALISEQRVVLCDERIQQRRFGAVAPVTR